VSGCRGLNFGEIMCTVSGMAKYSIFISSVQKELQAERIAVRDYIAGDALLRRYFETFLFEDLPATDRRADELYIEEVGRADVYVAILGDEYGPKMRALVERASDQLVRRRFADITGLKAALYPSLVDFLETRGDLRTRPFEERPCPGANLDDIAPDTVADFVRRARAERQFPLPEETPVKGVLTHLGLLPDGHVSNAAILLFGREPHRFIPCAEIRCMHFHGVEIERPTCSIRSTMGPTSCSQSPDRASARATKAPRRRRRTKSRATSCRRQSSTPSCIGITRPVRRFRSRSSRTASRSGIQDTSFYP